MDQTSRTPVKEEGTKKRTGKAAEAAAGLDTEKRKKNKGGSGDDRHVIDELTNRTRSSTLGKGKKTEVQDDEIQPLSGKPFFMIMISRSHLKPEYKMYMPAKLHGLLPSKEIPVVLMCNGKEWKMLYIGDKKRNKRFSYQFKEFAEDNNLKVDDACVFELMVCTESELKFRVQILRGDIPPEVQAIIDSKKRDQPIVID